MVAVKSFVEILNEIALNLLNKSERTGISPVLYLPAYRDGLPFLFLSFFGVSVTSAYNRTSELPVWVVYISAHAGVDWDPVTDVLEYAGKAMGEQKPPAEQHCSGWIF